MSLNQSLITKSILVAAGITLPFLGSKVYKSYQEWREIMIPGGLPGNFFGYLVSNILTLLFRKDRRNTKRIDYSTMSKLELDHGFLNDEEIAQYDNEFPIVARWTIPHRQISPKVKQELLHDTESMLKAIIGEYSPKPLEFAPSLIETHLEAVFFQSQESINEVAHLHLKDGTLHVYLTPFDAEIALRKGWGELHPLRAKYQPSLFESVLIFAPQKQSDIEIIKQFVLAGINGAEWRNEQLKLVQH